MRQHLSHDLRERRLARRSSRTRTDSVANLWVAAAFFVAVLMLGGASRADAMSTLFVRLAAIGFGAFALIRLSASPINARSTPTALLGMLAIYMIVQLIPLPPGLWNLLPGREIIENGSGLAGVSGVWRPISMSPDRTMSASFACIPPLAAFAVMANLEDRQLRTIVLVPLLIFFVSGVMGFLQILQGGDSGFYLYAITNRSSGVGLFANRNHQALALAQILPFLAALPMVYGRDRESTKRLLQLCLVAAAFIVPMIVVAGSRSGLLLLAVSLVASACLALDALNTGRKIAENRHRQFIMFSLAALATVAAIGALSARNAAFTRLFSNDLSSEQRFVLFGRLTEMAWRHLPFGSGFGSFDPVFRIYEPHSNLSYQYFNHAHNDFIELLIEGGAVSLFLALAGLVWFGRQTIVSWRGSTATPNTSLRRAASIAVLLALLASAADYPLRTPSMATFVAFCCVLMVRLGDSGTSIKQARTERET